MIQRVLWLNWKDASHPGAGGAEVVMHELTKHMLADGHDVTLLTSGYNGAATQDTLDGLKIIRVGNNRYLHSAQALIEYIRHHRGRYDIVIEVVNTAPYFGVFFGRSARRYLFYHQLAREVWYHEAPAPVSHVGFFLLEPVATRTLAFSGAPAITVSSSTRNDLLAHGFRADRTHIISEGITLQPVEDLQAITKFPEPTLLSLGALRSMKRTLDHIEVFELVKKSIPNLKLNVAGSAVDPYGQKVLARIAASDYRDDIAYLGKVSHEEKITLMQRSHLLLQTAVKEGWGLTVTEAASQGTPAAVYDADGLRDSVRNAITGVITTASPAAMAEAVVSLLQDQKRYSTMRSAAWEWSKEITFDQAYADFKEVIQL